MVKFVYFGAFFEIGRFWDFCVVCFVKCGCKFSVLRYFEVCFVMVVIYCWVEDVWFFFYGFYVVVLEVVV